MRITIDIGPTPGPTEAEIREEEAAEQRSTERFNTLLTVLATVFAPVIADLTKKRAQASKPVADDGARWPIDGDGPRHTDGIPPDLSNYRERISATFYDTALSPEVPPPSKIDVDGESRMLRHPDDVLREETHLFGIAEHVGVRNLTNLIIPGCLASDQTFVIDDLRAKVWFDEGDAGLYALAETGLAFEITAGCKPQWSGNMDQSANVVDEHNPADVVTGVLNMSAPLMSNPIHIPARQNFGVRMTATPALVAAVNALPGKKFIRVYLDGQLTRDVQ